LVPQPVAASENGNQAVAVTADAAARGRDPKRCGFVLINTLLAICDGKSWRRWLCCRAACATAPAGVVLTSIEVDQTGGLLTLRERGAAGALRLADTKLLESWFRES
jgi:hypothetical protein